MAHAQGIVLPGDVSVSLSAEPSARLEPYQTIHFTLTVTNNGPSPITPLALISSAIYDELTLYDGTNDCNLITSVADGPTDFWYYRTWYIAAETVGLPPLAVGETRTCHFTESLTPSAPAIWPYSFGIPVSWSDPDPSNNAATVYLRRAIPAAPVPALAPTMTWLLAGLFVAAACLKRKRA